MEAPSGCSRAVPVMLAVLLVSVACTRPASDDVGWATASAAAGAGAPAPAGLPDGPPTTEQVLRGRHLVASRACGDCHGGMQDPASERWLVGFAEVEPAYAVGPFQTWPRNLTPDAETGTGRYTERQIFNALRYGLRPSSTPSVAITSHVPGQGNHPAEPDYLAPSMPWLAWRYMSDEELWAIAAYLKHGLQPVRHAIPESQAPPDRWAGFFAEAAGPPELPAFPTAQEELRAPDRLDQILRGRRLVAASACGDCHGGAFHPGQEGWLIGSNENMPPTLASFPIGPFTTYPRNLTPDNLTGMGHFSERQIFNALRWGLRPGETADVEITSGVPGQGNHPINPKYLAPPMPWPSWRHMSDEDLRAIAAYLKNGVRPVRNRVQDSEGPPDFWASAWAPENVGTYPLPGYPTARERTMQLGQVR